MDDQQKTETQINALYWALGILTVASDTKDAKLAIEKKI